MSFFQDTPQALTLGITLRWFNIVAVPSGYVKIAIENGDFP